MPPGLGASARVAGGGGGAGVGGAGAIGGGSAGAGGTGAIGDGEGGGAGHIKGVAVGILASGLVVLAAPGGNAPRVGSQCQADRRPRLNVQAGGAGDGTRGAVGRIAVR